MIIIYIVLSVQACNQLQNKSKIRGNYKNVLEFQEGPVLSSRKNNLFGGGLDNSAIMRDSIYDITGAIGYTYCALGKSLEIELIQGFELNTFTFWIWDGTARTYNIVVYAKYDDTEKIILDTTATKSKVKLRFQDQLVRSFRIYNRGGNTENPNLYVIRVQAYYEF